MSPKHDENGTKGDGKLRKTKNCGIMSPGPRYKLKTLVGHEDHCPSKYREPAYTIGKEKRGHKDACIGPGPKYKYSLPGGPAFSIPRAVYKDKTPCVPGPQYTLPGFSAPAFTMVFRGKDRCAPPTSGPYDPPKYPPGPSYPFGLKGKTRPCDYSPAIRDVGPVTLFKPSSPAFHIIPRRPTRDTCNSPGPKYLPKSMDKAPTYPFGLKYSECMMVPRTECDEQC